MQTFSRSLEQTYPPPVSPVPSSGDGFPQFDPELDQEWEKHVANEPFLAPGSYPDGLDLDKGLLVKPWATLNSPLFVLSSYPTKASTVLPHNSRIPDVSNPCISWLLGKLGFWDTTTRTKPVLLVNLFPRRMDCSDFGDDMPDTTKLFQWFPTVLVRYWESIAMDTSRRCSTKVALIVVFEDGAAQPAYKRLLASNHSSPKRPPCTGPKQTSRFL
jgi:hypothetical protein